ncbi:hypothetical protein ACFQYP_27550 [Nonomuraea antimicrobica]
MLPIPERVRTLAATADVAKLSVDGAPSPLGAGWTRAGGPCCWYVPARRCTACARTPSWR